MNEAIVLRPGGSPRVEGVSVRSAGHGEVTVEVRATGVCHSDLHVVNGDWPIDVPLVLGHEAAGVVTQIGDAVPDVAVGDHVVLSWFAPCRRCTNCAAGRAWLCTGTTALDNTLPDGGTAFHDADESEIWPYLGLGTFTREVVVPSSAVVVVAPDLPFEVGALLGCAVTTGVGAALNTAQVEAGARALVVGCGGVGLSIIMGLSVAGATTIVAVDVDGAKLERARELGATHVVNTTERDLAGVIGALGGVDYAFEAIGNAAVMESLPPLLAPGGTLVLAGMTAQGARCSIDPFDLADQGKSIVGCNYGSSVPAVDVPRLVDLYRSGRLPVERLIGERYPLTQAAQALDALARGAGLRSLLLPTAV